MLRSLMIAATGMEAQKLNMDVISNNLANVNTTGFKRSRADFQDLLYEDVSAPGTSTSDKTQAPTGIQIGLGVKPAAVQKIFQQGDFAQTGNPLDLVIQGDGLFQVDMPDGSVAYSRAGAFKLDNDGRIVNSDGYPIEPNITIPTNTQQINIGADGTVTVVQAGSTTPVNVGQIQLAKFTNESGLQAQGNGLFTATGSSGDPILANPSVDGMGNIQQGYLEQSNVNIVEEMVNMIASERAYEINSKAVQASDQMLMDTNNMRAAA